MRNFARNSGNIKQYLNDAKLLFILAELGTDGNTSVNKLSVVVTLHRQGFFAFFLESPLSLTFDPRTFLSSDCYVLCIYFNPKGIVSKGFLRIRKSCNNNVNDSI